MKYYKIFFYKNPYFFFPNPKQNSNVKIRVFQRKKKKKGWEEGGGTNDI